MSLIAMAREPEFRGNHAPLDPGFADGAEPSLLEVSTPRLHDFRRPPQRFSPPPPATRKIRCLAQLSPDS